MILLNNRRFEYGGLVAVSLRSPSSRFFIVADHASDVIDEKSGCINLRGAMYHGRAVVWSFSDLMRDFPDVVVLGELSITDDQSDVLLGHPGLGAGQVT